MMKKITLIYLLISSIGHTQESTIVFPRESVWKYLDNGSDQGTAWTAPAFNDASWASGNAELGYGDVQTTLLSFGPSSSNKYPTTYFRTEFNLTVLPTIDENLLLSLKRDDGAIVYINGTEVLRVNMPSGAVAYNEYANGTVDGSNETIFFNDYISPSSLVIGQNTIAVEIHQVNASSSDISFDLELAFEEIIPLTPPVDCSQDLDTLHISRFVSVMPSAQPDSLRIPSTHTFQMLIQSGTPYTDPLNGNMRGLFDFTGYVPINGSSHNGYLSINHELSTVPDAGVSMMSIDFDSTSHLWNVSNNVPVDFSPVFGTGRNCSGTVTPWNTIITAEETLPNIDANGDGFQDIGFLVEIDPATASIVDHNNDGTPQKLFRMGRMSHENCVVAADRKTVYYGNDQNPGFVFKYVADEEENLSNGLLYVLKLDGAIDNTTTGSWIGIPNFTPTDCNSTTAYASSVGATNFNSVEDVEISPINDMIYFTSKASSRVYRFRDNGTSVSESHVFVGNSSFIYNIQTETGIVEEQWNGGVDNLTFDNEGNLYVIQDGGRNHIWMVPTCHTQLNPAVKLFAVTPAGSEPTGMTFSPDNKFMFVSIQHPSGSNTTEMIDASGAPIIFNKETAIVIARKEFLGADALELIAECTPTLNVTSNFQEPICFGEEVDFTASSTNAGVNATYQWKLNGNNVGSDATYSSNSLTDGDIITCQLTSDTICANLETVESSEIIMSVNPLPSVSISKVGFDLLNASAGFNTYQWYFEGELINGATGNIYETAINGNYSVEVQDANGCSTEANFTMLGLEINEAALMNFKIYPNPTTGIVTLTFDSSQTENTTIQVFDMLGNLILEISKESIQVKTKLEINLENQPSGIYRANINVDGKTYIQRIVKQ